MTNEEAAMCLLCEAAPAMHNQPDYIREPWLMRTLALIIDLCPNVLIVTHRYGHHGPPWYYLDSHRINGADYRDGQWYTVVVVAENRLPYHHMQVEAATLSSLDPPPAREGGVTP